MLATITDKKIGVPVGSTTTIDYYEPDIVSAQDYYPFGMLMPKRSYSAAAGYRYGFGGQEMNNDVKGLGNSYTAEFWEYDSRLGRRFNVDPRPRVSASPYSCLANNPILLNDSRGDTAIIAISRNSEIRFVGGQWIDSKTRQAVTASDRDAKGKNVFSASVQQRMNDYITLNGISEFSSVTDVINDVSNNVFLRAGPVPGTSGSGFDAPTYFRDLLSNGGSPDVNIYLAGEKKLDKRLFEGNKEHKIPTFVSMGHELGHVWDALNAGTNLQNFIQIPNLSPGLNRSEVNAMYWENVLRLHGNLPLRLFYSFNESTRSLELPANVTIGPMKLVNSTRLVNGRIVGPPPFAAKTVTLNSLNSGQTFIFNRKL